MQSKKVLLSGRTKDQYEELLTGLLNLQEKANGPFRLEKEFNAVQKKWVIHLRTRTWSEFFYESICAYPEEKAAIKKEVINALEHAFRPMILAARGAASSDFKIKPQGDINRRVSSNKSQGQGTHDDEDHADISPTNADKIYDDSSATVEPSQYVQIMETLLDQLKRKTMGVEASVYKFSGNIDADFSSADRDLLADTPSFGFTRLSALDFVANNVIVGSVNALVAGKNVPGSSPSLKRTLSAFKEGWNAAKLMIEPTKRSGETTNSLELTRDYMRFTSAKIISVNGLEHIENLRCIPDDVKRVYGSDFQGWGVEEWKNFYLDGCREMRGSIVRELYPSYYTGNAKDGGKMTPIYTDENVAGAVEAAFELSSLSRNDGKDPVAFMFAGLNDTAYEKIITIMEKPQANKISSLEDVSMEKNVLRSMLSVNAVNPKLTMREVEGKEKVKLFNDNKNKIDSPLLTDDESFSADDDSSDESDSNLTGKKIGGIRGKDVTSPTKRMLGQLMSDAKKNVEESTKVKKITEFSLKLSQLSTEDLVEVLRKLDESKLYDAVEMLVAIRDSEDQQAVESRTEDFMDEQNTSKQKTPQRPSRPALPSDIPTPSTLLVRSDLKKIFNERRKDLIKTVPQFNLDANAEQ